MKHTLLLFTSCILLSAASFAQQKPADNTYPLNVYRASATKINDLVHTKLDVKFDYKKRYLYGKAWITLKPHAYATDSLRLDAKGMDIRKVALSTGSSQTDLKYTYDKEQLRIKLGKSIAAGQNYTVYIDYTAKPDELKAKGSAAINDAKGLYFINPDSTEKGKPVQIWTQGESESSSAWFPTIDKPNQKTTEEITMTVPAKYVTLSNGKLTSQKKNADGTRTDTWKMDMPHAPYLFMMAVGDFKIYKDTWNGKEVNYYLEPKYAPFAKQLFGYTPEAIGFYSKKLGVDFPWNKYSQIVVRDYVSGAMENTTATLHGEQIQATDREMLDKEYGDIESTVVHELFHQWFGDYVTAESWSNLTVNESFANFSEILWAEYKHGADEAYAHNYDDMQQYLFNNSSAAKDLVRFHYNDKEDMFDLVSYNKGGRILNMLRNYLGDEVFFKGLNIYLKQNALGNGEAHKLRLALEEASGQDLNWYFNQWYFGSGHPIATISYKWDAATKTQYVYVKQTQEGHAFILPMAVDVYVNGKKQRFNEKISTKSDTFKYKLAAKPELVNVDADKLTLWKKTDEKPLAEYAYQFAHAGNYVDRAEAIAAAAEAQTDPVAQKILLAALADKYYGLRIEAIKSIKWKDAAIAKQALPVVEKLATADPKTLVQAAAIEALGSLNDKKYAAVFEKALSSTSYAVEGAALGAIADIEPEKALALAKKFEQEKQPSIQQSVVNIYGRSGGKEEWPYVLARFDEAKPQGRFDMMRGFASLLVRQDDPAEFIKGVDRIKDMAIKFKTYGADQSLTPLLEQLKQAKPANTSVIDKAIVEIKAAK